MKKLFIGGLPTTANEKSISALFSAYGTVRSIEIKKDIFSGQCRGFGFLEMEGHEARAALAGLDGASFEGGLLKVRFEEAKAIGKGNRRR